MFYTLPKSRVSLLKNYLITITFLVICLRVSSLALVVKVITIFY